MSQILCITRLRTLRLFMLMSLGGALFGTANDDLIEGQKSKQLVEEVKKKESELREETDKKISQVREVALKHLEKIKEQYLSQNKQAEAEIVVKEINQLRGKLGMPPLNSNVVQADTQNKKVNNDKTNQHLKYHASYLFDEKGLIRGKLNFMPNQIAKMDYQYKGKNESELLDWKDMGDHVQVDGGSKFGKILISSSPKSNQKTLLIRWDGELSNKLTDAHVE